MNTQPDADQQRAWRQAIKRAEASFDKDDFKSALEHARQAADLAQNVRIAGPLQRTAAILGKLTDWGTHARMAALLERVREPLGPPEWDGSHVKTLVVTERNNEHIGRPIRFAHLLPQAADRVEKCIALAEPRLIALFQRSFPNIEVRPLQDAGEVLGLANAIAGYQTLIALFGCNDNEIRRGFRPLTPDPEAVAEFRRRYPPGRLIGVSWTSTNTKKSLPALAEWALAMRALPATYISLQYGDVHEDIQKFREFGVNIIHDPTVDTFNDIDGLSAQIAALDAVISVSNTTVHLAGALGVDTYVVVEIDKTLKLIWPLEGENVPWYPSVSLIRKDRDSWPQTMARLQTALHERFKN